MHMQPVFSRSEIVDGSVAEDLLEYGLCIPCDTFVSEAEIERVIEVIRTYIFADFVRSRKEKTVKTV